MSLRKLEGSFPSPCEMLPFSIVGDVSADDGWFGQFGDIGWVFALESGVGGLRLEELVPRCTDKVEENLWLVHTVTSSFRCEGP